MNVALYVRVSTTEQAEHGYSLAEQEERLKAYCKAMQWTVYRVYTDGGFSGGNTDRPALQALIRDVQAGKVEKVVVWKLDRLSRSQLDTLYLIEKIFLVNNVDFVSMQENFDTATAFGRAMIGILAVFAQLEREQIKERMYLGKQAKSRSGYFLGQPPIGYDYIDGRLEVNPYEAAQIQRIFNEYEAGNSIYKILSGLNADGITHKYGAWKEHAIRNAILRETYIGKVSFAGQIQNGLHTPIISEEQFAAVQQIAKRRREMHEEKQMRIGKANSYLAGFLVCAECGSHYGKCKIRGHNGEIYEYYKCYARQSRKRVREYPKCSNKTYRMKDLDDLVFAEIEKLAIEDSPKPESGNMIRAESLSSEIKSIEKQTEKLLDLYAVSGMPLETLENRIKALQDRKKAIEAELARMNEDKEKKLSLAEVRKATASFQDILSSGDFDAIRNTIGILIDRIEIDNDNICVHWNF